MKGLQGIKDVVSLVSRLQNLCEGFDELNKNSILTSKVKILLKLSSLDKITPNKLSEKLGIAKSNLAALCNSLEKDGVLKKEQDKFDRRSIFLSITPKGEEVLENILRQMQKNFERELAYKDNIREIDTAVQNLLQLVE